MCRNRGISPREFVPKDLATGRVLDLESTLEELGCDEITFTDRPTSMDIKVHLAGDLTHTLRFVGNMLLAEALSRMSEHRQYNLSKYVVHLPQDKNVPSGPNVQAPPKPSPIDVVTPLSSINFPSETKRVLALTTLKSTKIHLYKNIND